MLVDCQFTRTTGRRDVFSALLPTTVACFRLGEKTLPDFDLRPELTYHKVVSAFGYQDIDFATHPEFSKSYLLRGSDENAIRMLFRPDMLNFFAGQKGWSVEVRGNWLVVYGLDHTVQPQDLPGFLEQTMRVFRLFANQ